MRVYRLYTERKRKKWLIDLVLEHFKGFTVFDTIGVDRGVQEKSICIEVITNTADAGCKINMICRAICGLNRQDCVLVVDCDISAKLYKTSCVEELT